MILVLIVLRNAAETIASTVWRATITLPRLVTHMAAIQLLQHTTIRLSVTPFTSFVRGIFVIFRHDPPPVEIKHWSALLSFGVMAV